MFEIMVFKLTVLGCIYVVMWDNAMHIIKVNTSDHLLTRALLWVRLQNQSGAYTCHDVTHLLCYTTANVVAFTYREFRLSAVEVVKV